MSAAEERFEQVWRHSRVTVAIAALMAVAWAVLGGVVLAMGQVFLAVLCWLWAVVSVVLAWRFVAVPFIAATESGVVVQNAFLRYTFAWSEIADVRGGYYGLRIVRTDGTSVSASAVQQPNIARWAGWRTRSDEVAGELLKRRFAYLRHDTRAAD